MGLNIILVKFGSKGFHVLVDLFPVAEPPSVLLANVLLYGRKQKDFMVDAPGGLK